jgi:protein-tyrosine-phosphatase
MAEVIFADQLRKTRPDWQSWRVESAGTWAPDGAPAAAWSQVAVARRGLSLANHRARTVTAEMLASFDLILTMEFNHKEALRVEFPSLSGRVFLLSEMAGALIEIADPIGGSPQEYENTATEIEDWLQQGIEKIIALTAPVSD